MGRLIDYINSNLDIDSEYYTIFRKHIPQGKMFCPFHSNTNTPAAKRYGNVIHCFGVCNKSYSVYDLLSKFNPDRINEIKSTIIIPLESSTKVHSSYPLLSLDRTLPIDVLVSQIISHDKKV